MLEVNRTLRLPDNEYFAEPQQKSGIALHHTVCRGARTTFELWQQDRASDGSVSHVATAYIVDQDGTVYEVFDPQSWAWQFGLTWGDPARTEFEKRFIGIEIANEGPLTEHDGQFYAFDEIIPQNLAPSTQVFDAGHSYRGYRFFARYQPAQLESLGRLVDDLCTLFAIPRVYPDSAFDYYGETLADFDGVIGHAMVRPDKSDPAPDPALWQILRERAGLTPTGMTPSPLIDNLKLINAMSPAAGSLVKDLVMELELRGIYLRLTSPTLYSVGYEVAEGARGPVVGLASALGLKATDRTLEVRHDA